MIKVSFMTPTCLLLSPFPVTYGYVSRLRSSVPGKVWLRKLEKICVTGYADPWSSSLFRYWEHFLFCNFENQDSFSQILETIHLKY